MEAGSLTIEMRQQTIEQVYDTLPTAFPYQRDSSREPDDKFARGSPVFGAVADDVQA